MLTAARCILQERIEADEELDDEPLALRLAAGLFTVQQAALIVTNLFAMADQGMQKRVLQLLHQQVRLCFGLDMLQPVSTVRAGFQVKC